MNIPTDAFGPVVGERYLALLVLVSAVGCVKKTQSVKVSFIGQEQQGAP